MTLKCNLATPLHERDNVLFMFKGNRKYTKNYRPIGVLLNMYKLFTKIITTRLEKKLDEN